MDFLVAVLLGFVQGLTEFVPVSSSGHLAILQQALGITHPVLFFDTLLHVGTLMAVCVAFKKEIWDLVKNPFQPMMGHLIIATIPAAIAALLLGDTLENFFFKTPWMVGICFLITAGILYFSRLTNPSKQNLNAHDSLWMGIAQAFAVLPGLSRSGLTTTMGMGRGLDRAKAAKFSLLMSLPAIAGGFVLNLKDLLTQEGVVSFPIMPALAGTAVAAVTGFYAIHWLVKLAGENRLKIFCPYLLTLGTLVILDNLFFHFIFS